MSTIAQATMLGRQQAGGKYLLTHTTSRVENHTRSTLYRISFFGNKLIVYLCLLCVCVSLCACVSGCVAVGLRNVKTERIPHIITNYAKTNIISLSNIVTVLRYYLYKKLLYFISSSSFSF